MAKRGAGTLDTGSVVEAALAVLDAEGLDGLTMRRLAKQLGVQNPALYWHFRNKQEIVDGMAVRMLAEAEVELGRSTRWDEWLSSAARAFRRMMLSHRDGARVVASADLSGSAITERHDVTLRLLLDAGFDEVDALVGVIAVFDYTLGATFEQQADPVRDAPRKRTKPPKRAPPSAFASALRALSDRGLDSEAVFEGGLRLLIRGLEAQAKKPASRTRRHR
jgi:TetR/AcrR family tetracycline transcriptional repressor